MLNKNDERIAKLIENGYFHSIDFHFADLMACLSEEQGVKSGKLYHTAALLSANTRKGHVCLGLNEEEKKQLEDQTGIPLPDPVTWVKDLETCPVIGRPGEYRPLILDDSSRLYLYRYYEYQRVLADFVLERARETLNECRPFPVKFKIRLDDLFGEDDPTDYQKTAACLACLNRFSVISGGPGTGKTTTVAKLLVLFIESFLDGDRNRENISIYLCAPTGKAARRLKESLKPVFEKIDMDGRIRDRIPSEVMTIHRMLGTVPGSPYFRYNHENRLPADLVVVDEASMVDLALMSKLVSALPTHASLVLLGDKDQLASVEAGSVLGDICGTGQGNAYTINVAEALETHTGCRVQTLDGLGKGEGMENVLTVLSRNYRFGLESGIGSISRYVNDGDSTSVVNAFGSFAYSDTLFTELPEPKALKNELRLMVRSTYGRIVTMKDPLEILLALEEFKILCAVRHGPYGVTGINKLVEEILCE